MSTVIDCGSDNGHAEVKVVTQDGQSVTHVIDLAEFYYAWHAYREQNNLNDSNAAMREAAVQFVESRGYPRLSAHAAWRVVVQVCAAALDLAKND